MRRLVVLLSLLLITISVHAEIYTLYPDGSGDFASIQEAIAGSVSGDEIQLADGVYSGPGNRDINFLGRSLTLRSISDNPEACVIDVEGTVGNGINEHGLIFDSGETSDTRIQGITVTNAALDGG